MQESIEMRESHQSNVTKAPCMMQLLINVKVILQFSILQLSFLCDEHFSELRI